MPTLTCKMSGVPLHTFTGLTETEARELAVSLMGFCDKCCTPWVYNGVDQWDCALGNRVIVITGL